MEHFVIIDNGFQPLTIITKRSILDVAAALDPPLTTNYKNRLAEISFSYQVTIEQILVLDWGQIN